MRFIGYFVISFLFAIAAFAWTQEIIRRYFGKDKICERHFFEFLKRWFVYLTLTAIYITGTAVGIEKFFTIKIEGNLQNIEIVEPNLHLIFYAAISFALIIACLARIHVFNNSYTMRDFLEINIFLGIFILFLLILNQQFSGENLTNITDIIWRIYYSDLPLISLLLSFIAAFITEIIIWRSFSEEDFSE